MSDTELIEMNNIYADDIWEFHKETIECDAGNGDQFAGCSSPGESEPSEAWARIYRLRKSEEAYHEAGTKAPSHIYMVIHREDDKVVGIIDLCHHINHPILGSRGGHCGYPVRSSKRGKGYAKEMLRLNKQNTKTLGIIRFPVICDGKNIASEKTIISSGGAYE